MRKLYFLFFCIFSFNAFADSDGRLDRRNFVYGITEESRGE